MCLFLCGGWIPGIKILVFYRNSRQNLLPFPGKKSCVCFCDFIYPCVHILRNILCTETKTSSPNIISYHTTDRKTSPLILFVFMCSYMYIRLRVLPVCICMFVYHGNPRQYPDHSRRVPEETGRSRARVPPNLGCHLPHSSTQFPGGRLEDYICKSDLLTRNILVLEDIKFIFTRGADCTVRHCAAKLDTNQVLGDLFPAAVSWLDPFCPLQKERRLLENRRLDLDICKARLKKAKQAEAKAAVSFQFSLLVL